MKLVDTKRRDLASATLAPTLWLVAACSALFVLTAYASNPSWWSLVGNTGDPKAVVLQGQLKWFTARAVNDLNAHLTNATLGVGGAGDTLNVMLTNWSNDYSTNGWNATNAKPSDFQVVNVGQLKYIASLYYEQLAAAGYTAAWPNWLYPNPDEDSKMAVVGQLKSVFNFDVNATLTAPTNLTVTTQSDGSIDVAWQDPSPNVTGYTLERSDDGGATWTNVVGATTADITDFTVSLANAGTPGTSQFRVTANNNASSSGNSSSSSGGQVPPDPGTAPAPPSNLTVEQTGESSFQLNWQDNSGGTSGFTVKGSKDGGSSWTVLDTIGSGLTHDTAIPNPDYLWIFQVFATASNIASSGTDIVSFDGTDTDLAPHYALVDIGPGAGLFVNNSGQVVYQNSTNSNYYFWDNGTTTQIHPPSSPSGLIIQSVAGLNNNGQVALAVNNPFDEDILGASVPPSTNTPVANTINRGTALWSTAGSALSGSVPNLLNSSYTGLLGITFDDATSLALRGNYPIGLNDYGDIIGYATELGVDPYWQAMVGVKNSGYLGDMVVVSDTSECQYVQGGGQAVAPRAINNAGTVIGTYAQWTTGQMNPDLSLTYLTNYPLNPTYPPIGFYGTGSDLHMLRGVPGTINDNGDIVGQDEDGNNVVWLSSVNKKLLNYTNAPGTTSLSSAYINNQMQTAGGWYHGRVITSLPTGSAISHDSGIILTTDGSGAAEAVPVQINIRKQGTLAAPTNGLIVKNGDIIQLALTSDLLNGTLSPSAYPFSGSQVTWKYRQLKIDGSFTDWTSFGTGSKLDYTTTTSGIFQVEAIITANGQTQTWQYTRLHDEAPAQSDISNSHVGPGRKGDPDYFGVCDTQIQIDLRNKAASFLGSTAYAHDKDVPAAYGFSDSPANTLYSYVRCNLFVGDMGCAAGATVPAINGFIHYYPPVANQWAGVQSTSHILPFITSIADWPLLDATTYPQPGFIIAHPKPGDQGHCAIIDYDGGGITSGGSGTVNKNYDDFYDGTSRSRQYQP